MSNELTLTTAASFTLARTSKAGKVSTRGLLGLIIEGTPAEREQVGTQLAREAWDSANYKTVLFELARVFSGRSWDMSVAFVGLSTASPEKAKMLQLMEALVRFHAEAKGVKAKYVKLCMDIIEFSKGEAERKEARRLAYEAAQKQ